MKKIREQVRERIAAMAADVADKSHATNYWRLCVDTDGATDWAEETGESWYRYDRDHNPVPMLADVGTGSVPCNCDFCEAERRGEDVDLSERDDVGHIADEMERKLGDITAGYFDDEANE